MVDTYVVFSWLVAISWIREFDGAVAGVIVVIVVTTLSSSSSPAAESPSMVVALTASWQIVLILEDFNLCNPTSNRFRH